LWKFPKADAALDWHTGGLEECLRDTKGLGGFGTDLLWIKFNGRELSDVLDLSLVREVVPFVLGRREEDLWLGTLSHDELVDDKSWQIEFIFCRSGISEFSKIKLLLTELFEFFLL